LRNEIIDPLKKQATSKTKQTPKLKAAEALRLKESETTRQ